MGCAKAFLFFFNFIYLHWINNYNAKIKNRSAVKQDAPKKKHLHRKRSGYNTFTSEFLHKEQIGGSAEVFRTLGEKWRGLPEESKEQYRRQASDSGGDVSLPSHRDHAEKIVFNMMKEVTELETLGVHSLVLCALDGEMYQAGSSVGEQFIADKDLTKSFGGLVQCAPVIKQEVSVKSLQELFNTKYSDLIKKAGCKMPYSRLQQLGIVFKDLPTELSLVIEAVPRKPDFYGSGQRRKLWQTQHQWMLSVSLPDISPSVSSTTPATPAHLTIANPASVVLTSSTHTITAPVSARPTTNTITVSALPTTHTITVSALPTTHTITAPVSALPTTNTITVSALPTTHTITAPVSARPTTNTITAPVSARPTTNTITAPVSALPYTTHPSNVPIRVLTSTTHPSNVPIGIPPTTSPVQVHSSTSTHHCQNTSSPAGVIISKETELGMMIPSTNDTIHAVCVLSSRAQIHGRPVSPGNVVVEVRKLLKPGLHPLCPGAFDDEVCIGGYYEWPFSQLTFLRDSS